MRPLLKVRQHQQCHEDVADGRWNVDPRAPKVISVNARSLRGRKKAEALQDLVRRFCPWVLCVQESKLMTEADLQQLLLWFPHARAFMSKAPSSSSAGVLTLIFNPDVQILAVHADQQNGGWLRTDLRIQDTLFTLLNVYFPPSSTKKTAAIQAVKDILDLAPLHALILMGDVNFVNSPLDKSGGAQLSDYRFYAKFCSCVAEPFGLVDAFRQMHPDAQVFSHAQKANTPSQIIRTRIDQCFVASHMLEWILDTNYIYTPALSDHDAMVLTFTTVPLSRRTSLTSIPPFLFAIQPYAGRITEDVHSLASRLPSDCTPEVWDQFTIDCFNACSKQLLAYRHDKDAALSSAIHALRNADRLANASPSEAHISHLFQARATLAQVQATFFDEQYWRRKYAWIDRSEIPSPALSSRLRDFKHSPTIITELRDSEGVYTSPSAIAQHAEHYYANLYAHKLCSATRRRKVIRALRKKFVKLRDAVRAPNLTLDDCTNALMQLPKGKCPGASGLPAEFFQLVWLHVKDAYWHMVSAAFQSGQLPTTFLHAVIILIHKKGPKTTLDNYRPITLLNADYKILAKALAIKMQPILQRVVDDDQTGFVKGRYIKDNVMLTSLLADRQILTGNSAIFGFCDFHKAYDSVDRHFLRKVLQEMGMPDFLQRWADLLHDRTYAKVCINGVFTSLFPQYSGVKQGCPWAPLLFVCVMEALSCFLKSRGDLGLRIGGALICLSMYADDTTVYLAHPDQLIPFKTAMADFAAASSLRLNDNKTKLMFVNSPLPPSARSCAAHPFQALDYDSDATTLLGIMVGNRLIQQQFLHTKVGALSAFLHKLAALNLQIVARSRAAKSYVFPKIAYYLDFMPLAHFDSTALQHLLFDYVANAHCRQRCPFWRMGQARAFVSLSQGGLGVLNLRAYIQAAQLKWLARFHTGPPHLWKVIFVDIFGAHPTVRPLQHVKRLSAVTWLNTLLRRFPLHMGGDHRETRQYLLSQPLFNNPLVAIRLPHHQPAQLAGPSWKGVRKFFSTVADMWDDTNSAPISFDVFHDRAPRIRHAIFKWMCLSAAVWDLGIPQASSLPSAQPGLLLAGNWLAAHRFSIGLAVRCLADTSHNTVHWWQQRYDLLIPNLHCLHSWLISFPLPPTVRQTLLLYASGALALRCKCFWLPLSSKICPCCSLASDDFLHFPSQCVGLHTLAACCDTFFSVFHLPSVTSQPTFIQACVACMASPHPDHMQLMVNAFFLHLAWKTRIHILHNDVHPDRFAVLTWLIMDFQGFLNRRDNSLSTSIISTIATTAQALHLAHQSAGVWHLDTAAIIHQVTST